ncbi:hypothetical protein PVK06_019728 [Gossypium arboreum]|uniref:Uncharacterized protein n=1 Tax=Gossypium arboreum TaxID=29729 RepID=A0ABR0PKK6_GOSAR|nr:hypothetical protein PVK06_019728 [Gossypium arboreum]
MGASNHFRRTLEDIGTTNLLESSYKLREVYNLLWIIRKLSRELVYSIPIIKIEEPEDPEEFPNWIVEDEYEENQEFLNWIVENFPDEDIGSEMEENV